MSDKNIYEKIINRMGYGSEYYTPRPPMRGMIQVRKQTNDE